eukprot:TRINITY_DN40298_c0_g1_i1.p1 TRINITY_DN40298_c0_g1~~TRINITY_DN40298_c0_g1_i1.p1  ORF type:complete len:298 (+),score=15.13 TRINITY_DN40298_c0_g1_i1:1487-2380(+)
MSSRRHSSTSSGASEGSSSTKHKNCTIRPCRSCHLWHYGCTPCGHYERAESFCPMDMSLSMTMCSQDCFPRCHWCLMQDTQMQRVIRVPYHDVTYRVVEEDIHIHRDDISLSSCRHGRVFNVCRAYIGEEDERVAVKWVRTGHKCEKDHYWEAIENAKEIAKIVRVFMSVRYTQGWNVKVLIPKKAKGWHRHRGHHTTVIVEPYLNHFESFYTESEDINLWQRQMWFKVLEALIHFSIGHSKRKSMISNIKGFVDRCEKIIYLSGPCLLDHKAFEDKSGVISSFMGKHKCSAMCRRR